MTDRGVSKLLAVCVAAGILASSIAGCATRPPASDPDAVRAYEQANDPLEPMNRVIFDVNVALDKALLKPVAYVYKEAVPDPFQNMIRNFIDNLRTPIILANDLLQGQWSRAGDTMTRFLMNSGLGLAGALDIATEFGVPRHDEDFGQTLAAWGTGEGAYLMLPLLGPSNPRDAFGRLVDIFFDPFTYLRYWKFDVSRFAADVVDTRARRYDTINELERTSLDYYATVRSLYRQRREDEIRNGAPPDIEDAPLPTISFMWGEFYGIQESHNRLPAD